MEKIWAKLNKIVSVVPFPDNGHIWRKYGRQVKNMYIYIYIYYIHFMHNLCGIKQSGPVHTRQNSM